MIEVRKCTTEHKEGHEAIGLGIEQLLRHHRWQVQLTIINASGSSEMLAPALPVQMRQLFGAAKFHFGHVELRVIAGLEPQKGQEIDGEQLLIGADLAKVDPFV